MMRNIFLKLPAPVIAAVLWFLSSQSTLPELKGIFGFDKVQHLIAYGALAFCLGFWFSPQRRRPWQIFLFCTAIASCYGAIDEFHQYFVPGRSCDIWDWIADTLGAASGAGLFILLSRIYERKRKVKNGI